MVVDALRVISDLQELRTLTEDVHGAQRIAWTPKWLEARAWFRSKLKELPVEHHYDAAGNSGQLIAADLVRLDRDGVSLEETLRRCQIDAEKLGAAVKEPANPPAYLELHIEQ